jgi:hypothetical protein
MQVADCYIHVEYRHLRANEFNALSERLLGVATELAGGVRRGRDLDFTFEEGTLLQRIALWGSLTMSSLDFLSHYHDLKKSVIEMVHDGEEFSNAAIKKFHELTNTTPNNDIYRRIASRDMHRLRRIINSFDQAAAGDIPSFELPHVRSQVIHDLAGLARAHPDDPEVAKIFHLLPRDHIPNIPRSPRKAIEIDDAEFEDRRPPFAGVGEPPPVRRPRRRFYRRVSLPNRRSR